jgi:hypothetical protein
MELLIFGAEHKTPLLIIFPILSFNLDRMQLCREYGFKFSTVLLLKLKLN